LLVGCRRPESRPVTAPPSQSWAKTYGGTSEDHAWAVHQTSDGGYIVAGYTRSFGAGLDDSWLLKLNSDGAVAWQKTYGGEAWDYAFSTKETGDSGCIVAGDTHSFGAGYYSDVWVLKLSSEGTVTWQKRYGASKWDGAHSIQQTSDGGYIVAGWTQSFGARCEDLSVLKLNGDCTVAWQKRYCGIHDDRARSIQQTSDGGYIVAGATESFGAGDQDFWVLKLDSDGTVSWQKTYGGTKCDEAHSIQVTTDGGYIVVGNTESFDAGDVDFWVLKLNSDGTITWQKRYGGPRNDSASSIQQSRDGGYVVAGYTASFAAHNYDFWVLKVNSDGTVAWQKTYGGTKEEEARSIQQTRDGGYIVAGYTQSFGAGGNDFWILKLDSDGRILFNPASGASVRDTNVVPVDTNCTVVDTTATVTNTSATVTDTNATVTDTNATIMQQAP